MTQENKVAEQPIKSNPKDEINPWPLVLYAPGNYKNTCASCEKQMKGVDKLCFMCLECAVIASHKYRDQLREENRRLREALGKIEAMAFKKDYWKDMEEIKNIATAALASVSDAPKTIK